MDRQLAVVTASNIFRLSVFISYSGIVIVDSKPRLPVLRLMSPMTEFFKSSAENS